MKVSHLKSRGMANIWEIDVSAEDAVRFLTIMQANQRQADMINSSKGCLSKQQSAHEKSDCAPIETKYEENESCGKIEIKRRRNAFGNIYKFKTFLEKLQC